MDTKRRFSLNAVIALGIFVVVFGLYVFTLCPTIYIGPSAEAVCDIEGVGLTPPISHPIWVIVGRLFSAFSGNTAFMLNLMSALFGALTISMAYLVFAGFEHARTAEEEARYQVQPYFRQVAAAAGALLVAFSYPFWEGSLLAGPDTMNTFFLILVVFLLQRYVGTSKSRYIMFLGLIYGLAVSNYPTLLLLSPIILVFLVLRGRELFDDPVALVITLLLFCVGILPSFYVVRSYWLHKQPYVDHASTVGQVVSVYLDSYFTSLKALFLQRSAPHDWLFWLFIPTFVPVLFLLMRRGDYDRGSAASTRLTYAIRYAFVILFTLGGLAYLWGYLLGPVGMADVNFLRHSRYLGSYVIVGAWLSYFIGYWMVILTSKFKATGTEPVPKLKYRKKLYLVIVIVAGVLGVAGMGLNFGKSTKRNADYVKRFAEEILKSSPDRAVIIVPIDPFFGSIGAPLRYVKSKVEGSTADRGRTIVDLNAAYFDFYQGTRFLLRRLNTARYLAETILGTKAERPRQWFIPESPLSEGYDRILRCEMVRAVRAKERPRPICGLVNNFLLSPLRVENNVMNIEYRAEPHGLLYVYRSRGEYRDVSRLIDENEKRWKSLSPKARSSAGGGRSEIEEYIAGEYSKSLNDLGVVCQIAGRSDAAEGHFRRALKWSPENSSALWNLAALVRAKGEEDEAKRLSEEYELLSKEQRETGGDFFRRFGLTIDFLGLVQSEEVLAQQQDEQSEARRVGILRLAADMKPSDANVHERIGNILFPSERSFSLADARNEYWASLERLDPKDDAKRRWMLRKLALVYAKMEEREKAERLFNQSVDETDPSTYLDVMEFYVAGNQNPREVAEMGRKILEWNPAADVDKKVIGEIKNKAASIVVKVLLRQNEAEKAKESLSGYLEAQPEKVDILLSLAAELRGEAAYEAFRIWLHEEYVRRGRTLLLPQLCELARLYFRQGRYQDVVQIHPPDDARAGVETADFYHVRAQAHEALGKDAEAEKDFERARLLLPENSGNFGNVLLNNLAWRYFKNGSIGRARTLAEEALQQDPANSLVWDTYGWILYKAGADANQALDLIEQSHIANPGVGIIGYHYAKLLVANGQREKARPVLEMAIDDGIESQEELEDARNTLRDLKQGN